MNDVPNAAGRTKLEQKVGARFAEDIKDHQLHVLREDGLYRHLRCRRDESFMYGFDIVTWPGYLAYVGDMGDFVFSRIPDMLAFFASDSGRINPGYWSEKLQAPAPAAAEVYSPERYVERVQAWAEERCEDLDDSEAKALRESVQEDLLDPYLGFGDSEFRAHSLLVDFRHDKLDPAATHFIEIDDSYEWSLREWDMRFLWCCYALVWAVGEYRKLDRCLAGDTTVVCERGTKGCKIVHGVR